MTKDYYKFPVFQVHPSSLFAFSPNTTVNSVKTLQQEYCRGKYVVPTETFYYMISSWTHVLAQAQICHHWVCVGILQRAFVTAICGCC